jgi:hypothetical protein
MVSAANPQVRAQGRPSAAGPETTVAQVGDLLGYGAMVWMLIISGDLRSLKDGRAHCVLPDRVDEYVDRRLYASEPCDDVGRPTLRGGEVLGTPVHTSSALAPAWIVSNCSSRASSSGLDDHGNWHS